MFTKHLALPFSRKNFIRCLVLAIYPLCMSAQAFAPQEETQTSGNITILNKTLQYARHGDATGGAEIWTNKNLAGNGQWQQEGLSLTTFASLTGVDIAVTNDDTLHIFGVEKNTISYMSRPKGKKYFGNRKTLLGGVKVKQDVGVAYSKYGNLEVIAPVQGGGLAQWYGNKQGGFKFSKISFKGRQFDNVALMQNNYSGANRLEAIVREGNKLIHFTRQEKWPYNWTQQSIITQDARGDIAAVQRQNSIEVIAEVHGNKISHFAKHQNTDRFFAVKKFGNFDYTALGLAYVKSKDTFHVGAQRANGLVDYFMWHDRDYAKATKKYTFSNHSKSFAQGGKSFISNKSMGVVAIHTTLMPNGKLLALGYSDNNASTGSAAIYDTQNGSQSTNNLGLKNMFCSGHGLMANGQVLVAGGHGGPAAQIKLANIYDPKTNFWRKLDNFNAGRWYPTVTTLEDGRMMIMSGSTTVGKGGAMNNTLQLYKPGNQSISAPLNLPKPFTQSYNFAQTGSVAMYPFVYQLPSGNVAVHSGDTTRQYKVNSNTWIPNQYTNQLKLSRNYPTQTASVMLPLLPEKNYKTELMVFGGASKNYEQGVNINTPSINNVERIDLSAKAPKWRTVAPMKSARVLAKSVILPNDQIMLVGGSSKGWADHARDPVANVEAYNPTTNNWEQWNPIAVPRLYHSNANLMPDGRVLLTGTDKLFNPEPYKIPQHRVEVFEPPYLFNGQRPIIANAPKRSHYGQSISLQIRGDINIGKVRFVKTSSSTHAFDMSQRSVGLNFKRNGNNLTITMPKNGKIAPPGHYMLFVSSKKGVPCVAPIINLK